MKVGSTVKMKYTVDVNFIQNDIEETKNYMKDKINIPDLPQYKSENLASKIYYQGYLNTIFLDDKVNLHLREKEPFSSDAIHPKNKHSKLLKNISNSTSLFSDNRRREINTVMGRVPYTPENVNNALRYIIDNRRRAAMWLIYKTMHKVFLEQ